MNGTSSSSEFTFMIECKQTASSDQKSSKSIHEILLQFSVPLSKQVLGNFKCLPPAVELATKYCNI